MFERLELLIGSKALEEIKAKTILVVGLGGVGGYIVTSLIRSGIENIIIIDYDKIDLSNINRQIIANTKTIGMDKTSVMENMLKDINPTCNITSHNVFLDKFNLKDIFNQYKIDYIVDACDTVKTKEEIIRYALDGNIKFITSMGTGNKMDPSQLEITDIRKTKNDPLARIFRKWVKDNHINKKIMVLSSTELPKRVGRVVASNSFVPASAGLLITSYIINDIIKGIE